MIQDLLTAQLSQSALFAGLAPAQLREIARHAEKVMFHPGEKLTVSGQPSSQAILIVDGELDCLDGVGSDLERSGNQAGLVLGEMAMFIDDYEHSATFEARSPTKAALINRDAMLALLSADPQLAEHLVSKVSDRLRNLVEEIRSVERNMTRAQDRASAQALAIGKRQALASEHGRRDGDQPAVHSGN
ncbi:MAG: Crp/Fnr family transcriptional regulator [Hyphomicrobiaceae bacterium]